MAIVQQLQEEFFISRLKNQDKVAFTLLYEIYSATLFGVILRIVKEEIQAEEALQDCFNKIWGSIQQYDSSKGRLITWLITIARQMAIDKISNHSYQQVMRNQSLDALHESSYKIIDSLNLDHIGVKELTAKMPVAYSQIIDLIYFEGYSPIEAATRLGIPLETVKTRFRIALKTLRELMVISEIIAA